MSYIIYLKNNSKLEYDAEKVYQRLLTIEKSEICSVHKLYHYTKPMNICLYDYGSPDIEYLDNYRGLEQFYGENAIEQIDEQIVNYLQNKPCKENKEQVTELPLSRNETCHMS